MRLNNKRALITDGSDGIGLAIAEAFLREGADITIAGRDAGKLEAAHDSLTGARANGTVETLSADLATGIGIGAVVELVERFGRPDDLAGMAVHLASDKAAWTSGGIFAIDGGYTAG